MIAESALNGCRALRLHWLRKHRTVPPARVAGEHAFGGGDYRC